MWIPPQEEKEILFSERYWQSEQNDSKQNKKIDRNKKRERSRGLEKLLNY